MELVHSPEKLFFCSMIYQSVQEYRSLWSFGAVSNLKPVIWKFFKGKLRRPVVHIQSFHEVADVCNFFTDGRLHKILVFLELEGWEHRIASPITLDKPPMTREEMEQAQKQMWTSIGSSLRDTTIEIQPRTDLDTLRCPLDK